MDEFQANLLRFVAGGVYFSLGLQASREMFGKSYFSLGLSEKQAVDNAVLGAVQGNAQALTPEMLYQSVVVAQPAQNQPQQNPKPVVGFQVQPGLPKTGS
jgi:hypothetical protein